MSRTWEHQQLGTFTHNGKFGWIRQCDFPAFKVFKWKVDSGESTGKYDLVFKSDSGEEPSLSAVALSSLVIVNQVKLARLITSALWEDFNGRGPDSGMWWHRDLDGVAKNFKYGGRSRPSAPEDLPPVMQFSGVAIRGDIDGHEGPLAQFSFAALFEEEHGVGVLTDGTAIVGAGYSCDVSLYESK